MGEYILVSQGIEIYRTADFKVAYREMEEMNQSYYAYRQHCLDIGIDYADNEVFMYEEVEENGKVKYREIE